MNDINNIYLMTALEHYPYNLTEAIEALNYAMSFDQKDPIALGLLGLIHAEQFKDYDKAIECYQEALIEDLGCKIIYPRLVYALILNEDFEKAENTLEFALKVKGIDQGELLFLKSEMYERMGKYRKSLKILKLAKIQAFDSCNLDAISEAMERVKLKINKGSQF